MLCNNDFSIYKFIKNIISSTYHKTDYKMFLMIFFTGHSSINRFWKKKNIFFMSSNFIFIMKNQLFCNMPMYTYIFLIWVLLHNSKYNLMKIICTWSQVLVDNFCPCFIYNLPLILSLWYSRRNLDLRIHSIPWIRN